MIGSKSIFLVEDDKDDQDFFTEALNEIANTNLYAIATNGIEALHRLKNSIILPDIIFMDINMPVMNGIECLIALTQNPLTKHIPVVILTTDNNSMKLIRELGAKAFIKKPNNYQVLLKNIEQIITLDFNIE